MAANDLDRAVDRIGGTRIQSGRTEAQRDFIVFADGHLKLWCDLGNGGAHVVDLIGVSHAEDDVIVGYLQAAGISDDIALSD
jgi:hypothetical protein